LKVKLNCSRIRGLRPENGTFYPYIVSKQETDMAAGTKGFVMNTNQIINMVIRAVTRRAVNAGVNAGISAATGKGGKRGSRQPQMTADPSHADELQHRSEHPKQKQREIRQARRARRAARQANNQQS
jgi:hypothetical protein